MISPLLFALVLSAVAPTTHSLQCLVSRPGHGLVSEKCPPEAIACRIAVEHHAVIFYPWSPIYDRNQFACVMPNEFKDVHGSGCIQKRSGRVRCWCFAKSDCNTPENSKLLYEAFRSKDAARLQTAVDLLDSPDGTKEPPLSTTATTKPTAKSMRKHVKATTASTPPPTTQSTIEFVPIEAMSTPAKPRKAHKHHHHHSHRNKTTTTTTHRPTTMPTTTTQELSTRPPFNLKPKVMPRPTEEARSHVEFMPPPPKHHRHPPSGRSDLPADVKVIHVNNKHAYENVLGSAEFARAFGAAGSSGDVHALPTDAMLGRGSIDEDEIKALRDALDSEEDGEEEKADDSFGDSLTDLPMSENEAAIYLNDEPRESRVRPRNLQDTGASSYDFDDSALSAAPTRFHSMASLLLAASFLFILHL